MSQLRKVPERASRRGATQRYVWRVWLCSHLRDVRRVRPRYLEEDGFRQIVPNVFYRTYATENSINAKYQIVSGSRLQSPYRVAEVLAGPHPPRRKELFSSVVQLAATDGRIVEQGGFVRAVSGGNQERRQGER